MAGKKFSKQRGFLGKLKTAKIVFGKILSKIPIIIWGGFAVFGIFIFGVFVGLAASETPDPYLTSDTEKRMEEYRQVINAYQDLSKLFYMQGQDMDIITDFSRWEENPGELRDALDSFHQKRDEILFEFGRVYEVRNRANLPQDPYIKTE